MKKTLFTTGAVSLILTAALLLTGCGSAGSTPSAESAPISAGGTGTSAITETEKAAVAATATLTAAESELFTARDLAQTADLSQAKALTVSDGETLTIAEAGVYVLSGSAENATVVVDAGDDDKVQLVLDGLSMVNAHQPCILVKNADKVFLTSAEGSASSLTVSGAFTEDCDAAIFSSDDLVLNGLGAVTVRSTGDGIRTNDDLKLTGGAWTVDATDTALKAHDSISAVDGVYTLTADGDGLHAEDSDDDTTGSILIEGGSFTIRAGDDGIHATTSATVNGGSLDITAAEGIEATQVTINDGTVSIQATDDGINAGRKSSSMSVKIEINGGEITIVMGAGDTDGIDSNGDLIISGGTVDVTAQSPFDYDGACTHTSGTVIVNGVETDTITNQFGGGMQGGQPGSMPGGQMPGGMPGGQKPGSMPGGQADGSMPGGQMDGRMPGGRMGGPMDGRMDGQVGGTQSSQPVDFGEKQM